MKMKAKTPHQAMAKRCKLHANILAVFQRLRVVPRDVADFTDEHIHVLQQMAVVMKDPVLLGILLKRKPKEERSRLVAECDDVNTFRNWERRALKMFQGAYEQQQQGKAIAIREVLRHLRRYFNIQPSPYIKLRLFALKNIAAKRAGR